LKLDYGIVYLRNLIRMKPNIFSIATKELSQDAFIAWLLQWADPKNQQYDAELHQCGVAFFKALLAKKEIILSAGIESVKVQRQHHSIDVFVTAKIENGESYIIVIEDKVSSGQHGDQLERYKAYAEEQVRDSDAQVVLIYTKTRFESKGTLDEASKIGYSIFGFKDFSDFFERNKTTYDVYNEFAENIKALYEEHQEFSLVPIKDWYWELQIGFLNELESKKGIFKWFYVANPRGGFLGALASWEYWGKFPVYLQLEGQKLAFKISVNPEEFETDFDLETSDISAIRNHWYSIVYQKSLNTNGIKLHKPQRFGSGNYMTVAMVETEDWLGNPDELVNIENVIANLNKYKEFLNECLQAPVPEEFTSWVS
jgi:hypothetical protein